MAKLSSSPMHLNNPALPLGSLILVTGANGFIGAHVVNQLLAAGYRVRGTVRNVEKNAWLSDIFTERYGEDSFTLCKVDAISQEGAFDEAVKGVDGVVHVASETGLSEDAQRVVSSVIAGALNCLKAAATEPSVKRFVFISSSTAVYMAGSQGTPKQPVNSTIYNDPAVAYVNGLIDPSKKVPHPAPGVPDGYMVYAASKTLAEKAVWKYVEEEKPSFTVNSVIPNATFGAPIDPLRPTSSVSLAIGLFKASSNDDPAVKMVRALPPKWSISVQDAGRLHVAALVADSVKSERLFGFVEQVNWNVALGVWRKQFPDRKFVDDIEYAGTGVDESDAFTVKKRANEVLESVGYGGFQDTIAEALIDSVEVFA